MSEPLRRTAGAELEALRAAGAPSFDPPAYAFVENLATRAKALGGSAGARLEARALQRAEALTIALEAENERARSRAAAEPPPANADHAGWIARLQTEARARGVSVAGQAQTPSALTALLYEASRSELHALLAATQAEAEIPTGAGPYNPLAVAARTLGELSTRAPAYLTALVAQLDAIAPLLALPLPPVESARPSAGIRKRRTQRPAGPPRKQGG